MNKKKETPLKKYEAPVESGLFTSMQMLNAIFVFFIKLVGELISYLIEN